MSKAKLRVGILGASGYTGAELVRLLRHHPHVEIQLLTAERSAGKPLSAVFPHFSSAELPILQPLDAVHQTNLDVLFLALPHGTTQALVTRLADGPVVIDLSADFRLADPHLYQEWYGQPHQAIEHQNKAVYGLVEFNRSAIADAQLIAVPGCYPTCSLLPLVPLIEEQLIDLNEIVIDAKSGVSGAGRGLKETSLFTEISEGLSAYGVGKHRHMPEIEQVLATAAGEALTVSFTPHLVPINRGMMATIYLRAKPGGNAETIWQCLDQRYQEEAFVTVLPFGQVPATQSVRGTNQCYIGVAADRRAGRAIIVAVIDNLGKGASGQAVQNLNCRFGWPETLGLEADALFP